jgi:hypothetical protein
LSAIAFAMSSGIPADRPVSQEGAAELFEEMPNAPRGRYWLTRFVTAAYRAHG